MTDHNHAHQHGPASKRVRVRGIAIAAGVCIAFVTTGCKNKNNAPVDPANDGSNPASNVGEPPGKFIRVTAEDLDAEFDENRAAAEAKYKNKVIEVSGKVKQIIDTDPTEVTVELEVEGDDTVDCDFLRKNAQQAVTLVKGQAVVIRGKCVGLVDGTVTLERCNIVK